MLKPNLPFKMMHGRMVQQFDWDADAAKPQRIREPGAGMWAASILLQDAVPSALAQFQAIDASPDFTPSGRGHQKREWLKGHIVPQLQKAMAAHQLAQRRIDEIRAEMTGPTFDRSDIAGALQRQEIRTWLRSMPVSERAALLSLPDHIHPAIAAAVFELPAELSGLEPEDHDRLRDRAMAARHPDKAAEIDIIEQAAAALDDQIRMAHEVLGEAAGESGHMMDEMTGRVRSLQDVLDEKLAGLPHGPATDPGFGGGAKEREDAIGKKFADLPET